MARERENEDPRLLTPSMALGRFNPAYGVVTGLKSVARQRVRYGFRTGYLGFLIKPDTVSEVVEQSTIYLVPHTPAWLAGLINLRGNLVPVFDLQLCLELEKQAAEKRYLLVLDTGDDAVGLFVETLPQPVNLTQKLTQPPPLPAALRGHVASVYSEDKTIWVELDHRNFFESLATSVGL